MDRPRRPLHSPDDYIYSSDTGREYMKLLGVFFGILLLSLILTFGRGWDLKYFWTDFVAIFLITSAAYKFFRFEVFSEIFKTYDIIARRWPAWSYILPFIEIGIGADYLLSNGSVALYLLTIAVMALAVISFIQRPEVKSHIQYACLDRVVRLPLATLSLIEGTLTLVLALMLLFVYG